ncbi:uncharacterized protein RJT21DRAFT_58012 [Scheffersomyces amazonensis]|uniref:uncharacterized protein n=1 Tax=Scheffersomyces amazonensis TaxID=1078765 RepID=UPI00315D9633
MSLDSKVNEKTRTDPPTPTTGTYLILATLIIQCSSTFRKHTVGMITVWIMYVLFTWSYIIDQWRYINDYRNSNIVANVRLVVNQNLVVWVAGTVAAISFTVIGKTTEPNGLKEENLWFIIFPSVLCCYFTHNFKLTCWLLIALTLIRLIITFYIRNN